MNKLHNLVAASAMFATLGLAWVPAESTVILRDGARAVIIDVSIAGVTIPPDSGRPVRVLPLSLVRTVEGPLATKFEENRQVANDLWRAGSRLKRHDPAGADPILENLWKLTAGFSGPTRAEIAAGLLACRVWRGASAFALEPWAEWIDQSVSLDTENAARVRAMVETLESGDIWIASMPPVWIDSSAVRELASAKNLKPGAKNAGHPTGADVREIYAVAARRDTGLDWGIDVSAALKSPGWANIAGEMVLAEATSADVRSESRQRLSTRLATDPPQWKQAWIRLGLGRSLLLEESADERRNGVLNLLWVASRPEIDHGVAAIALADAARGLDSLGDIAGTASVLADLERRFPDDPIVESVQVANARRLIGRQRTPASPSSTTPSQSTPAPSQPAQENPK